MHGVILKLMVGFAGVWAVAKGALLAGEMVM